MAKLSVEVIEVLRTTAARLRAGAPYQWGHAGHCNCGHLAQTVTALAPRDIYRMVGGEWSEHLYDYCPLTGESIDDVAARMVEFGFEATELADLEWLRDVRVLSRLRRSGDEPRHLRRNDRADVILYLETWADGLEERLNETTARADPMPEKRVA